MRWRLLIGWVPVLLVCSSLAAQQSGIRTVAQAATPPQTRAAPAQIPLDEPMPGQPTGPAVLDFANLKEQARGLVAQAQAGSGSAAITLARYPGHYTMLTARSKSGGAELHKHYADFLIVLEGSGVELTGGTMVEPKEQAGGEVRGLRLDGATPHALKAGDIIHIPAGTPHQAIEQPGQTITIYVIKVEEPANQVTAQ